MAYTSNYSQSLVGGTSDDDSIYNSGSYSTIRAYEGNDTIINAADYVPIPTFGTLISGTSLADFIYNFEWHSTINAGAGNDTICDDGSYVSINGGAGNDCIINTGAKSTIDGGAGNDTIINDGSYNVIQFGASDGNDLVEYFGSYDTLQITEGSISGAKVSGSDYLITVKSGSTSGKLTLVGAADVPIHVKDTKGNVGLLGYSINNNKALTVVSGTSSADAIYNDSSYVTINAGAGKDTIINEGQYVSINGGAGNDYIRAYYTSTVRGGKGNDTIFNNGSFNVIQFGASDGNDLVQNFDGYDTIQITDGSSYSTTKSGSDVIVSIGSGSMLIKDAPSTINITVGSLSGGSKSSTGVTLSNSTKSTLISGTNYADYIYNTGWYVTINAGAGNDTIYNDDDCVSINGGAGNDYIINTGAELTIDGGAGNDTIINDDWYNVIRFGASDGNDLVEHFGIYDTLQITEGSISGAKISGSDYLITVKSGSTSGKLTLAGAADVPIRIKTVDGTSSVAGYSLTNLDDKKEVIGTSSADAIYNDGSYVTINAGVGKDTIINEGQYVSINGGAGNDYIHAHIFSTVKGGAGNDTIFNDGWYNVIQFGASDGNDLVQSFTEDDTIQITDGSISGATASGSDYIITVKSGNSTGTLTLESLDALTPIKVKTLDGTLSIVNYDIYNFDSGTSLSGTSKADKICNDGWYVSINGGAGNDYIRAYYTSTVRGGKGNDTIFNSGSFNVIQFGASDGNDLVQNFDGYDTIQITDGSSYSTTKSGSDVIVSIGSGSMLIKDAPSTINITGGSYVSSTTGVTLSSSKSNTLLSGTSKADSISSSGSYVTIVGGKGNDTIKVDGSSNVIKFGASDGNDRIQNFSADDTLQLTSGSIAGAKVSGSDYLITVKSGSTSGRLTLVGAADVPIRIKTVDGTSSVAGYSLANLDDKKKVNGTSAADKIFNGGATVTIVGGKGNDTIVNVSSNVTINGGAGSDRISLSADATSNVIQYASGDGKDTLYGLDDDDTIKITGSTLYSTTKSGTDRIINVGSGSMRIKNAPSKLNVSGGTLYKSIFNSKNSTLVSGSTGRDSIVSTGSHVTIKSGKGADTIEGSDFYGDVFLFAPTDGRNVITNFDQNDTLKASSGKITYKKSGANAIVTIKSGSTSAIVTLKGAGDYNFSNNGTQLTVNKAIRNTLSAVTVLGTSGTDSIVSTGSKVTIKSGAGNDTITGSDSYGDVFLFAPTDGRNVITNFGNGDTLLASSGTIKGEYSGGSYFIEGDPNLAARDTSTYEKSGMNYIVTIKGASSSSVVTLKGSGNYNFITSGTKLMVDTAIRNTLDSVVVSGTSGADWIVNTGSNVTIKSGKGNDTITGSDSYGDVFLFAPSDGRNVITNFDPNDTLKATSGTISSIRTSGEDAIVTIRRSSIASVVTLKGAASLPLKQSGAYLTVNNVNPIENFEENIVVEGTDGRDDILNHAEGVTLSPGAGNDTITGSDSYGDAFYFTPTDGKNVITNFGKNDSLRAASGKLSTAKSGNNLIATIKGSSSSSVVTLLGAATNTGIKLTRADDKTIIGKPVNETLVNDRPNRKFIGTSNAEYLVNEYENVTIESKSGNDTIVGSDYGDVFLFAYTEGNDVVRNFDAKDTLISTSGTINAFETVGNDIVVTIKSGSTSSKITLQNTASQNFVKDSASTVLTIDYINIIHRSDDNLKIIGSSGRDSITSTGECVTIQSGKGNDTIRGSDFYGDVFVFAPSSDDNLIENFGRNDTLVASRGTLTYEKSGAGTLVKIEKGTDTSTVTLANTSRYEFVKDSNKLTVKPKPEPRENDDDRATFTGTDGDDYLINSGADVTIKSGAGNDTLEGSDFYADHFVFAPTDEDNLIMNFGYNDTLDVVIGTLQPISKLDDDYVVEIKGAKNTSARVTLRGTGDYKFNRTTNSLTVEQPENLIINTEDDKRVNGKTSADYIINGGANVTIDGKGGRDTIVGSDNAELFLFNPTYLENVIMNFGAGDTLRLTNGSIDSGKKVGDDYIVNVRNDKVSGVVTLKGAGAHAFKTSGTSLVIDNAVNYIANNADGTLVEGSPGKDWIINGGQYVTLQSGGGNDTLEGSTFGDVFAFAYNSGQNVITNFDENDTLVALSGKISAVKKSGENYIVTVASGSNKSTIVLQNTAGYTFDTTTTSLKISEINSIESTSNPVKGTIGRDLIMSTGDNATITANAGNDTIIGSDAYGDVFSFSYTHGDNVIINFEANDSLYASNGTLSFEKVGDDVLVSITKSGTTSTILLEGVNRKGYAFKKTGRYLVVNSAVNPIVNDRDNSVVSGSSGADFIVNNGQNVTIQPGKGNDTIDGSDFAEVYYFVPNGGKNVVTDFGINDTLQISDGTLSTKKSGADVLVTIKSSASSSYVTLQGASGLTLEKDGKKLYAKNINVISNASDRVKLGSSKDDYITNHGSKVTITAGAGDDTIVSSDLAETFTFAYNHGNDVIENFGTNDTIRVTSGVITSYYKSGDDMIVEVASKAGKAATASMTLKGVGGNSFRLEGTTSFRMISGGSMVSAQLASEDYWFESDRLADQSVLDPLDEILSINDNAIELPPDFEETFRAGSLDRISYAARHVQRK